MKTADLQGTPAPPSLMRSLMAGFDAISNHGTLLLFPILLDLLLWLGPRLSLGSLTGRLINEMSALPEAQTPETIGLIANSKEAWLAIGERFNLASFLRSYPVGVPSLMAGSSPLESPLGASPVVDVPSVFLAFGMLVAFFIVGIAVGALYFNGIAQAALTGKLVWAEILKSWPRAFLQSLLLAIFWLVIILAITVPFSCLFSLFLFSGGTGAQLALFLFGGLLAWFLLPLVFSPHGIFASRLRADAALLKSAKLTRLTLPSTGLFILLALLLSQGTDILWRIPDEKSWVALAGVGGHAFVTTALLAASFVYYRDTYRWVERLIQQAQFAQMKNT